MTSFPRYPRGYPRTQSDHPAVGPFESAVDAELGLPGWQQLHHALRPHKHEPAEFGAREGRI